MEDQDKLIQDFYAKYAPDQELTPERLQAIKGKYGNDSKKLLQDFYSKYAPDQELTDDRYNAISKKYSLDLKKKSQPQQGEPTASPSTSEGGDSSLGLQTTPSKPTVSQGFAIPEIPEKSINLKPEDLKSKLKEIELQQLRLSPDIYDLEKKIKSFDEFKSEDGQYLFENQKQIDDFNSIVREYEDVIKINNDIEKAKAEFYNQYSDKMSKFGTTEIDNRAIGLGKVERDFLTGFTSGLAGVVRGLNEQAAVLDDLTSEYTGRTPEQIKDSKQGLELLANKLDATSAYFNTQENQKGAFGEYSTMINQGLGNMAVFFIGGGSVPAGMALGASMNTGYQIKEAEDKINDAKILTQQQFNQKYKLSGEEGELAKKNLAKTNIDDIRNDIVGSSSAIGVLEGSVGLLGRATKLAPVANYLTKLNSKTGGQLSRTLRAADATAGSRAVAGFLTEATQEGTAQYLNNIAAKDIYDETRSLFDGVPEEALVGGVLGSSISAVRGKSESIINDPNSSEAEVKAAQATLGYIENKLKLGELQRKGGNIYVSSEHKKLQESKQQLKDAIENQPDSPSSNIIREKIAGIDKQLNEELSRYSAMYENMTQEEQQRVDEINTRLGELQVAENDSGLLEPVRESINREAQDLINEKKEIEGKYQSVQEVDSEQGLDFTEDELAQLEAEVAKEERIARDRTQPKRQPRPKQEQQATSVKPIFAMEVIGEKFVDENGKVGTIKEEGGGIVWESEDGNTIREGGSKDDVDKLTIDDMGLSILPQDITQPINLTEGDVGPEMVSKQEAKETMEEQEVLTEIELEKREAKAEQDAKVFEDDLMKTIAQESAKENRLIFELGGNEYSVTKNADGTSRVSQKNAKGKFVGIKDEAKRKAAISEFNKLKEGKDNARLKQAEQLSEEFKKEQEDKVLAWLDSAIGSLKQANRGQLNAIGLVPLAAEKALRIVRAAYKGGMALSDAIKKGYEYAKSQNNSITEIEFKKFVLEQSKKKPQPKPNQPTSEEVRSETPTQEQRKERVVEDKVVQSISKKRKNVERKAKKKSNLLNVKDDVLSLTELPLHRITDPALASEVNEVLKDADKSTPVIDPKKVKDITDRAKKNLNEQEAALNPDDFTPKNLKERIDNFFDSKNEKGEVKQGRVSKIPDSDFDKTKLRTARASFTRALNDLRMLDMMNNIIKQTQPADISEAEYNANRKRIQEAKQDLISKVEKAGVSIKNLTNELNKENKKEAKSIKPTDVTEDKAFQEVVQDFLNVVEDSNIDDIGLSTSINDIMEDLRNGFIPFENINTITNDLKAENALNSNSFEEAQKRIDDMPKEKANSILRFLQKFDPRPKLKTSLKAWETTIRNMEFWQWDDVIGTSKSGLVYEPLNNVVTAGEQYNESTSTEMAALQEALKFPVMSKDITKSKAVLEFAKKALNDLYSPKKQTERIMVGMAMIERRRRDLFGETFYDKVFGSPELLNQLDGNAGATGTSQRQIYQDAFDALPKNEDGSIDLEASFKELKKNKVQASLIDFLEKKLDKNGELANKQKVANSYRGMSITFDDFYIPILRMGSKQSKDEFTFSDFNSMLNPKISSDRGKEISDPSISMVQSDPLILFSDYVHQVNRDYYMTNPVRVAYKFFNGAINKSKGEAKSIFEGMQNALKANIANSFNTNRRSLTDRLLSAAYAYYLTTAYRAVAEPAAEGLRSFFAGDMNSQMIKAGYDSSMSAVKNMFAKIKGAEITDKGDVITTKEFRSRFKKLLAITNSPFNRQFSRQFSDGSIRTSVNQKGDVLERASREIMGLPNKLTLWMLWTPAFENRWKEITGDNFNYDKIDDANWIAENRANFKEAGSYANMQTARFKGYANALGGRTMNRWSLIPFVTMGNIDVLKSPDKFKINQFLGTFGWRDMENIQQGVKDLVLYATGQHEKFGKDKPLVALRNSLALTISGMSYPMIMTALTYLAWKDDDEEDRPDYVNKEIKDIDENGFFSGKRMAKEALGYGVFLSTSKYGYASRSLALLGSGYYVSSLANERKNATPERKREIDKEISNINNQTRSYFYTEPIIVTNKGMYGGATTPVELAKVIPGYGLPAQFADDAFNSYLVYQEKMDMNNPTDEDKALMLLAYDVTKLSFLALGAAKGTAGVIPMGKEVDKIIRKEKFELRDSKKSSGKKYNILRD